MGDWISNINDLPDDIKDKIISHNGFFIRDFDYNILKKEYEEIKEEYDFQQDTIDMVKQDPRYIANMERGIPYGEAERERRLVGTHLGHAHEMKEILKMLSAPENASRRALDGIFDESALERRNNITKILMLEKVVEDLRRLNIQAEANRLSR